MPKGEYRPLHAHGTLEPQTPRLQCHSRFLPGVARRRRLAMTRGFSGWIICEAMVRRRDAIVRVFSAAALCFFFAFDLSLGSFY